MSGAEVTAANTVTHTADTPQLLLEHHLKELRLPTFLREYPGSPTTDLIPIFRTKLSTNS